MCLVTTNRQPSIAENDIHVLKVGIDGPNGDFLSTIHRFKYERDVINRTQFTQIPPTDRWAISNRKIGNILDAKFGDIMWSNHVYRNKIRLEKNLICIAEGFHSISPESPVEISEYIRSFSNDKAARFIIPKGSKYYEESGEYVSEQIIFKEFIQRE